MPPVEQPCSEHKGSLLQPALGAQKHGRGGLGIKTLTGAWQLPSEAFSERKVYASGLPHSLRSWWQAGEAEHTGPGSGVPWRVDARHIQGAVRRHFDDDCCRVLNSYGRIRQVLEVEDLDGSEGLGPAPRLRVHFQFVTMK